MGHGPGPEYAFCVPFRFPVHFTRAPWETANPLVRDVVRRLEPERRHRAVVVLDDHVASAQVGLASAIRRYFDAHRDALELIVSPVLVPGGETCKNDIAHAFRLLELFNDVGLDRQSCVIVVGGGAVLDMVSFAAAIAHRGIRILRLPTTVLAQADSGIAVKNSVNLFGKKNFIGTFVPPFGVINDTAMLATLSRRDTIAGISEAIKVALLKDPTFFEFLETNSALLTTGESEPLAYVVRRSAELHLAHICGNGDPFELGSARPLDFGHWSAHKLESMTSHRLRHGEAVAIGMAIDLTYSVLRGVLDQHTCTRILRLMDDIGLPTWDDALLQTKPGGQLTVIKGLQEFREHLGGLLHITLVSRIGHSFEVTEMDESVVTEAIAALRQRSAHQLAGVRPRAAGRGLTVRAADGVA